jgi:hypothetical protein
VCGFEVRYLVHLFYIVRYLTVYVYSSSSQSGSTVYSAKRSCTALVSV